MPDLIICDTSCLILFDNINKLNTLQLCYDEIFITPEVALEYNKDVPDWIKVEKVQNGSLLQTLKYSLGTGEASTIALSLELSDPLLALDDLKARKIAKSLNLNITGSLGILIKAKEKGIIKKLKPIFKQIEKTNFRISSNILNKILALIGE